MWGSVAVALLTAAIVFLFLNLSTSGPDDGFEVPGERISVYGGIPSDAVVVLDFKKLDEYRPLMEDTLSFAHGVFSKSSGMVQLQEKLLGMEELGNVPFVYSLHYSAKNQVSFLQVLDLEGADKTGVERLLQSGAKGKKYNGVNIYSLPDGVAAAIHGNLMLASSSQYVLESSVRHLENGSSILDNKTFGDLLAKYGAAAGMYINHNQIGKFFSGVIERGFLGYSDFIMKFTSWSRASVDIQAGRLTLRGTMENDTDESRFSRIFELQHPKRSQMGKILPASTLFSVSLPVSDINEYLKAHNLYLEVQKKQGAFAYKQKLAQGESKVEPEKWIDSLKIEELVAAYCKFGEKCEWLTFIRGKQQFGLNNVISSVVDGDKVVAPEPFRYKGYVASVFGELFSHSNEEAICRVGAWTILGPQKILEEFANGNAYYSNLDHYLGQTPAKWYLSKEASLKILANVKEAGDSVLQIFKPYSKECLQGQLQHNNFEFLVMDLKGVEDKLAVDIDLFATNLEQLPLPKEREAGEEVVFAIDSTIHLPEGPYEVWDVSKKAKAYIEQLPNMRLRYMDANKKGVWAIPFDTPVCGYVEQIDLYDNGRLQMLFASGSKMYLLDRVGRFVYGYPVKLPKKVVMGPKLVKDIKGMKHSVLTLNEDNTVSWYDVSGKPVQGWKDIVAPEFVKELPEPVELGGTKYWVLRAPSQLLLYTLDGKRLEFADKKKKIDRDSDVAFVQDGVFRVKCTDGKEYNWNLETGKLKKWSN